MKKILLIEDDQRLSESVSGALVSQGFSCDCAYDGQMAIKYFQKHIYDLVLLDLNLPLINGLELCTQFRKINAAIPLIIITAFGDIDSKMEAFNLGADDYLVKPFHLKELLARIRIFLKRAETTGSVQSLHEFEDLTLDPNRKTVNRRGKEIRLTPKEFMLLEYFLKNRNRTISKDELAMNLWDANYGVTHNTIEVYINFLRNKIDKDFDHKLILTKPGFGYFLNKSE